MLSSAGPDRRHVSAVAASHLRPQARTGPGLCVSRPGHRFAALSEAMTKREWDYRCAAARTVELAHQAKSTADKDRLLRVASGWLDLADRAHGAGVRWRRPALPLGHIKRHA
jgi:hypothetical protein